MTVEVLPVALYWLPLAALVTALLTYGISRDRGRRARKAAAVMVASGVVLAGTGVLAGWAAYQQHRAEQAACTPSTDC